MTNLTLLLALAAACLGRSISPQNDTWNTSFTSSQSQIAQAGFNSTTANNVDIAIQYEQTNWATDSVHSDPFYTLPVNASQGPAGSLLKVEQYTDTSLYTLPPKTALSRILFQSKTING